MASPTCYINKALEHMIAPTIQAAQDDKLIARFFTVATGRYLQYQTIWVSGSVMVQPNTTMEEALRAMALVMIRNQVSRMSGFDSYTANSA